MASLTSVMNYIDGKNKTSRDESQALPTGKPQTVPTDYALGTTPQGGLDVIKNYYGILGQQGQATEERRLKQTTLDNIGTSIRKQNDRNFGLRREEGRGPERDKITKQSLLDEALGKIQSYIAPQAGTPETPYQPAVPEVRGPGTPGSRTVQNNADFKTLLDSYITAGLIPTNAYNYTDENIRQTALKQQTDRIASLNQKLGLQDYSSQINPLLQQGVDESTVPEGLTYTPGEYFAQQTFYDPNVNNERNVNKISSYLSDKGINFPDNFYDVTAGQPGPVITPGTPEVPYQPGTPGLPGSPYNLSDVQSEASQLQNQLGGLDNILANLDNKYKQNNTSFFYNRFNLTDPLQSPGRPEENFVRRNLQGAVIAPKAK